MRKCIFPLGWVAIWVLAAAYVSYAQNAPALQTLPADYDTPGILLAKPLSYQVLHTSGDKVLAPSGQMVPQRGKFDFMTFVPEVGKTNQGYLVINHETSEANDALGDGGGVTIIQLKQTLGGHWEQLASPRAVDFSPVGGTWNNCLGGQTPWGTVLTSEEYEPSSNKELYKNGKGVRDTSALNGYDRYLNYGWMVELDPASGQVLGKRWAMGRFSHEGALCMPDERTVYLMDDYTPSIFFKFVADQPRDLFAGTLYAYKLGPDGRTGTWLALPRTREAMNNARNEALKLGATIFIRLEDVELSADGKALYITETGLDSAPLDKAIALGGVLAPHHAAQLATEGSITDYYGRLFVFDLQNQTLDLLMACGPTAESQMLLTNPDNIGYNPKGNYLLIHEDINGTSQGRAPEGFKDVKNELFLLDLNAQGIGPNNTYSPAQLQRVLIVPYGAETTGGCWSPDFKTYFLNIQHPNAGNQPPYNFDTTIAITGF